MTGSCAPGRGGVAAQRGRCPLRNCRNLNAELITPSFSGMIYNSTQTDCDMCVMECVVDQLCLNPPSPLFDQDNIGLVLIPYCEQYECSYICLGQPPLRIIDLMEMGFDALLAVPTTS